MIALLIRDREKRLDRGLDRVVSAAIAGDACAAAERRAALRQPHSWNCDERDGDPVARALGAYSECLQILTGEAELEIACLAGAQQASELLRMPGFYAM